MSNDRKVSTDALETLGTIIDETQRRDAIHLAVEPVVAVMLLQPGQDVGLVKGGAGICQNPVGIVDPFLKSPVQPGERFWLVVYPRVITSLRHVWSHPAFADEPEVAALPLDEQREASRVWLTDFADRLFSYYGKYKDDDGDVEADDETRRTLCLDCLIEGLEYGGHFGTDLEYTDDCQPSEELWMHYERYTGKPITDRPSYFRCAC